MDFPCGSTSLEVEIGPQLVSSQLGGISVGRYGVPRVGDAPQSVLIVSHGASVMDYVYAEDGCALGYIQGRYIHAMNGSAVGQLNGRAVPALSGEYVGELDHQMVSTGGTGIQGTSGIRAIPETPAIRVILAIVGRPTMAIATCRTSFRLAGARRGRCPQSKRRHSSTDAPVLLRPK
jgi:hypothetical protein